ncbi:toxin Cry1Ac domain D-VI-related protein [Paenibacillus sp. YIM B09110]|uniref:toxin Cry1Ac domain D-VI-related protein n=1 Tax=Paenibacillus sp. YIM B09110 TaxID=3126102 RepID=UPI00301C4FB3
MKKITIISILAVLLVAGGSGFTIWKINDNKEKKELATLADISSIQEKVNSLYNDETKTKLADHINEETLKSTHDLFVDYSDKKLSPEATALFNQASQDISDVDRMYALKQGVDSLFDSNGAIIETADSEIYKKLLDELKSNKPAFVDELMIKINEADAQKEQISNATKLVDLLFTSSEKSTVKEAITRAEIDDAKAKINSIKQDTTKTALLSYIQVADVHLEAKLKAEAEAKAKAEAEAKAKADAEAKAKAEANKSKNNNSGKKSDDSFDINEWTPYDTDNLAQLIEYLASGDVIEYNGQYYASPSLVNMIANEEVVYFHDIAND